MPAARPYILKDHRSGEDRSTRLAISPSLSRQAGIDLSITANAPPRVFVAPSLRSVLARLGPITVEQNHSSPIAMERGITTIFALPVAGVPGLDLTANFFAGHRDTRLGAPPGSAAVTGGIRWRW